MAAASSIARWLLDEALSGTIPTMVADGQGSNDLTIDYSSGDANWTSTTGGRGLDFTASPGVAGTAIAELSDIANNGNIGSSLDGATEASLLLRVRVDDSASSGSRLFFIGSNSGDGDFAIVFSNTNLQVRWDEEADGTTVTIPKINTEITIGISVDTSQGTASNRVKVYIDGVLEGSLGGTQPNQNVSLGNINSSGRSMCLGNRPSQNRNIDGAVFYAELFTGVLTDTQHADAHTALEADNDANWDTASQDVTGTVTVPTEDDDTVITGSLTTLGTIAVTTEDDDTVISGEVSTPVTGTIVVPTEDDTTVISGTVATPINVIGLILIKPEDCASVISGTLTLSGTATLDLEDDTSLVTTVLTNLATLSIDLEDDTTSISGAVGSVSGIVSITTADDLSSISGTLTVSGIASFTSENDTTSIQGTATTPIVGSVTLTTINDTSIIIGNVAVDVIGTIGITLEGAFSPSALIEGGSFNEKMTAFFRDATGLSTYSFNELAIAYYQQSGSTSAASFNDALSAAQKAVPFVGLAPTDWRNFL